MKRILFLLFAGCFFYNCTTVNKNDVPVIGFVDQLEDNTLKKATEGFYDALKKNGFSEKDETIKIIYRNAQGDIPALTQIIKYFISQKVDLIAANPTLSTITAIQNTQTIPVFMMVSGIPENMGLEKNGKEPPNLFGVGENLNYIDTAFSLIPELLKTKNKMLRVGMIYNHSEPQSVEALNKINALAGKLNVVLIKAAVNNSADVQLVTQSLLNKNIDAFFANPDNTVFASFETIIASCNKAGIPVFTSEAGLVERGALVAFGADIYQWGYDAGEQAAQFLKSGTSKNMHWQLVSKRKRVYNKEAAKKFGVTIPQNFEPL